MVPGARPAAVRQPVQFILLLNREPGASQLARYSLELFFSVIAQNHGESANAFPKPVQLRGGSALIETSDECLRPIRFSKLHQGRMTEFGVE